MSKKKKIIITGENEETLITITKTHKKYSLKSAKLKIPNPNLENFYNVIREKSEGFDLTLFKQNYKDLIIKKIEKEEDVPAYYDPENNEIVITKEGIEYIEELLPHELLHCSSAKKEKNEIYCGFCIKNSRIGNGLNEIYTEILTARYFKNNNNFYNMYAFLVKPLENIIGRKNMEKYYSTSDLYGLIKELTNYYDLYEVLEYIAKLDRLIALGSKDKLDIEETKEILEFCSNFIINGLIMKEIDNPNQEQAYSNIEQVIMNMPNIIYDSKTDENTEFIDKTKIKKMARFKLQI